MPSTVAARDLLARCATPHRPGSGGVVVPTVTYTPTVTTPPEQCQEHGPVFDAGWNARQPEIDRLRDRLALAEQHSRTMEEQARAATFEIEHVQSRLALAEQALRLRNDVVKAARHQIAHNDAGSDALLRQALARLAEQEIADANTP